MQLGGKWLVREQGWKMNESRELFDMSDAPFTGKPVAVDTDASRATRTRLAAVLAELNPAGENRRCGRKREGAEQGAEEEGSEGGVTRGKSPQVIQAG